MIVDFLEQFNQSNKGDTKGTIWATKNIDPNINNGKINISKILGFSTDTDDQANLEAAASGFAFTSAFTTDRYFAVADDRVWQSSFSDPNSAWSAVTSTPTDIDINSDIIAFNSKIYIATQNFVKSYTQAAGFNNVNAVSSNPHSFCIYANRLYVTDNNDNIESMDTSETYSTSGSYTLDLNTTTGESQLITKISAVSDGIWIATVFTDKAGGEMIFWDGATANVVSSRYKLTRGALAMTIKDDRPYIIDSFGRLRVFDGTTFTEIARLPIKDETIDNFNDDSNDRWVHPNGMILVNDEIYILIRNTMSDTSQNIIENMSSGVWAYSIDYGFYCKYPFSNVDVGVTPETPKGGGIDELAQVGAIISSNATGGSTVDRADESEILVGVKYYTDATATKAAFGITNVINDIKKIGCFVTAQLNPELFDEAWKEVVAFHDLLKNSTDRIIIKYRTSESTPIYGTGTWSNDLRITSTSDLSNAEQGNELEILRGDGAGVCYHITNGVELHGSNYRLDLDYNPFASMTGTCKFRIQNWKKVSTQDTTDSTFIRGTLDTGSWIQLKLFMVGTGKSPQLTKLLVSSTPSQDLM